MKQLAPWLMMLAAQLVLMPPARAQDNLVLNGSFAHLTNGKPDGWEAAGDTRTVDQALDVVRDSGRRCARLRCTRIQGEGGAAHAMLAQVGRVKLEQGRIYEFSCLAREDGIKSRSVTVAISDMDGWQPCGLYSGLSLERKWKPFRVIFRAARSVEKTGRLQIWFTETGTLYVSDVRVEPVQAARSEFTDVIRPMGGRNLVPNGSFAVGASGWSSLGISTGWGNLSRLHGAIVTRGGPDGGPFLRIPLGGDRTPVLYFDYYRPLATPQTRVLAASEGWIPVEPGKPYTVSCWIRSNRPGVRAIVGAIERDPGDAGWQQASHDARVIPTADWQRFSWSFTPKKRYLFVNAGPDLEQDSRVDVDVANIQLEQGDHATAFEPRAPVEVGIEPSSPAGIFTQGATASLLIRAANHAVKPASLSIRLDAFDWFDRPEPPRAVTLKIPSNSAVARPVPLPAAWRGFYRVHARWTAGGHAEARDLRVAIVPGRTTDDSVLGINHAFPDADLIHLASKAGVAWYRDWSLKWEHIEPSPGNWRWQVGDTQIDRVLKERVKLMALLPPFPSAEWSSEAPEALRTPGYPGERARQAYAPRDPGALATFIESAAARYKGRIPVWEFLNEPVYTDYALPAGSTKHYTPADYVNLLRVASAAMKRADPGCKVMGGVAAGPTHFTRELMDAGILPLVDIFNLHIYPGTRAPEGYLAEMDALLRQMDAHGGRKPIWMTEFSYYGVDDLPREPFVPGGDWAEERLLASERECAEYTVRFLAIMLSRGVQKVFIHSGASGAVNDPNFECCLFAYGGAPRKILPALAVFTDLAGPHPRFAGEKTLGEDGHALAFECGSRSVVVTWDVSDLSNKSDRPDTLHVGAPGVRCLDIVGRPLPTRNLRPGTAPVYLLGPAGAAARILQSLRR